jgi:dihydroorotate dehydrogenase electron transfer subunit
MLRTLSEIAFCKDIPCQVSLESRMACGVGACQGCAVPTEMNKEGDRAVRYQRACKEGPVFDSNIIFWDYKSILLKV